MPETIQNHQEGIQWCAQFTCHGQSYARWLNPIMQKAASQTHEYSFSLTIWVASRPFWLPLQRRQLCMDDMAHCRLPWAAATLGKSKYTEKVWLSSFNESWAAMRLNSWLCFTHIDVLLSQQQDKRPRHSVHLSCAKNLCWQHTKGAWGKGNCPVPRASSISPRGLLAVQTAWRPTTKVPLPDEVCDTVRAHVKEWCRKAPPKCNSFGVTVRYKSPYGCQSFCTTEWVVLLM